MTAIVAINEADAAHLAEVVAEMQVLGAPVLRCIRDEAQGIVLALEGSHRLAAAHQLGLTPVLQMIGDDDELLCSDIGYDDCGWFEGEPARAADIRDRIGQPMGMYTGCVFFDFDDIEA